MTAKLLPLLPLVQMAWTVKLYGPGGVLFIGTQAGCAQAAKDCGLEHWQYFMGGLNRYERQLMMACGKPLTGKARQYFLTQHRL